ncbi:MAG: hypothetical protein JHC61_01265 [Burkholderiaceae bacterium]|nr:hypothetical protein [Burkholderiaceae bacterium]
MTAADVGPVATLRLGGVRVVVSLGKSQMLDRNLFRTGGVQPERTCVRTLGFAGWKGWRSVKCVSRACGPSVAYFASRS